MNDGTLYTGVDEQPDTGLFENEVLDDQTKQLINDQRDKLARLTPAYEAIIEELDKEMESVMSIDRFIAAAADSEDNIRAELQAAALYKKKLQELKSRYELSLKETQS